MGVHSASNFCGNGQKKERTLVGQLERTTLNSWISLLHLKTKPDPAFETLFLFSQPAMTDSAGAVTYGHTG
jgi:hypothetical protein